MSFLLDIIPVVIGAAGTIFGNKGGGVSDGGAGAAQAKLTAQQANILQQWWDSVGASEMQTAGEYQVDIAPVLQEGFKNWLIGRPQAAAAFVAPNNAVANSPVAQSAAASVVAAQSPATAPTPYFTQDDYTRLRNSINILAPFQTASDFKNALAKYDAGDKFTSDGRIAETALKAALSGHPDMIKLITWARGLAPFSSTLSQPKQAAVGTFDPTQFGIGVKTQAPNIEDVRTNWGSAPVVANRGDELAVSPGWESVGKQYADIINARKLMGLDTGLRSMATAQGAAMAQRGLGGLTPTQQQALLNYANRQRVELEADTLNDRMAQEAALRAEQNSRVAQKTIFDQQQLDNWYDKVRARQNEQNAINANAIQRAGWSAQQNTDMKNDFWDVQRFLSGQGSPSSTPTITSGLGSLAAQYGNQRTAALEESQARQKANSDLYTSLGTIANYWIDKQQQKNKKA